MQWSGLEIYSLVSSESAHIVGAKPQLFASHCSIHVTPTFVTDATPLTIEEYFYPPFCVGATTEQTNGTIRKTYII